MRATGINIIRVMIWLYALISLRIVYADSGYTVLQRKTIDAGVRAEVFIERSVLLHDDDNVLNLTNAAG